MIFYARASVILFALIGKCAKREEHKGPLRYLTQSVIMLNIVLHQWSLLVFHYQTSDSIFHQNRILPSSVNTWFSFPIHLTTLHMSANQFVPYSSR